MIRGSDITVKAYVHVGEELVDVDTLDAERRQRLATELKKTWLNHLFAGQAVFTEEDNETEGKGAG